VHLRDLLGVSIACVTLDERVLRKPAHLLRHDPVLQPDARHGVFVGLVGHEPHDHLLKNLTQQYGIIGRVSSKRLSYVSRWRENPCTFFTDGVAKNLSSIKTMLRMIKQAEKMKAKARTNKAV
jgi:hypothetical protein